MISDVLHDAVSDIQTYRRPGDPIADGYNKPPCGAAIDKVVFLMDALREGLDGSCGETLRPAEQVMTAIAALDTTAVEAALAAAREGTGPK